MYEWLIENKELFKLIYSLMVVLICIVIVLKTDKLFKLSFHNGIRYFRNAFFFYGIGFVIRYFVGSPFLNRGLLINYQFLINILFEFFLVMAGFFLVYSLLWKKFETEEGSFSSLFNSKTTIFYLMTFIIIILDHVWSTDYLMFISQVIIFLFALIISFVNLKKSKKTHIFPKFYVIAMFLSLVAWLLNFLVAFYFNWNQGVLTNIYILNAFVFLLFLFGVIKVTNKN